MKEDFEQKIRNIVEEFFKKMGWQKDIKELKYKEKTVFITINTQEAEFLIGKNGQNLVIIQQLIGKILKKQTGENFIVDFDVNDYKKKKIEFLKTLAKEVADEVTLTKKEKILQPMSSFERRIIHLALAEREDVVTESQGKEPKRCVVIKPAVF